MIHVFKKVIDYPITLDNFSYNASDFVNNIYVGPQGDLLRSIERFNVTYNTSLSVTKNFTLKPGAYDLIKKAYANWVLRWDMKPRGIESIFNRIRDYNWRARNFQNDIMHIHRLMAELKSNGLKWQDNTEDLIEEIDKLKTRTIDALKVCEEIYPNVDIQVKMIPLDRSDTQFNSGRSYYPGGRTPFPENKLNLEISQENRTDYILTFVIHIKKSVLTIHSLQSDNTINREDVQATGDLIIVTGARMLSIIGRCWGRDELPAGNVNQNAKSHPHYLEAIYLDNMAINKHPYISNSSDQYTFDLDEDTCNSGGNICTGNMGPELKATILNGQVLAHIEYIIQWLSNYYIPQTNPLNRLHKFRDAGKDIDMFRIQEEVPGMNNLVLDDITSDSCTLDKKIYVSMKMYAKKRSMSVYGSSSFAYSANDIEFAERVKEYLNHISIQDLPCSSCVYHEDCKMENNIMLFLKEEKLTEMEEAYLGMYVEIRDYDHHRNNKRIPYFVEELIEESYRWDIGIEYDTLLLSYQIAIKAISLPLYGYNIPSFFNMIRDLKSKHIMDLEELNSLTDEELQNKPLAELVSYRAKAVKPVKFEDIDSDDNVPIDFDTMLAELQETEIEMTSEERTLRWASQLGGAENL